jgi:hypothetical protein
MTFAPGYNGFKSETILPYFERAWVRVNPIKAHLIEKYEVVLVDFFDLIPIRNTSKFALVPSPD